MYAKIVLAWDFSVTEWNIVGGLFMDEIWVQFFLPAGRVIDKLDKCEQKGQSD